MNTIVAPDEQRAGPGENFTPFASLAGFGQRIVGAAGQGTNIELYPRFDKLGDNGPILAAAIRQKLGLVTVVVHPCESAACATAAGTWHVPGPVIGQPLLTTGAGDHFNAGFATGQLLGLTPESCLALGVSTSGHYVRTGQSPSLADLETFLANWR